MTGSVYEIAFSPDPEQKFIYMVDGANGEIRIVNRPSLEVVGRFGQIGRQAGQFVAVHNVTVDRGGNIYTAEVNTGQRVQKFRRIDMQN
jgi:sugar lactone lactonase YvrE